MSALFRRRVSISRTLLSSTCLTCKPFHNAHIPAFCFATRASYLQPASFFSSIKNFNHLDQEPGEKNNEYSLRLQFDSPQNTTDAKNFSHYSFYSDGSSSVGLFMDSRFQSPSDFISSAKNAISKSDKLVSRILSAISIQDRLTVTKLFDQLSDTLCQIMDAAEVIRQVHTTSDWKNSAEQTYSIMLDYMNNLNTHFELYQKIKQVNTDPSTSSLLSGLERQVGKIFLEDFEKSGIHLDKASHEAFVQLNNRINSYSRQFMSGQSKSIWDVIDHDPIKIPISKIKSIQPHILSMILKQSSTYKEGNTDMLNLLVSQYTGQHILRDCEDESVRKSVYIALNKTDSTLLSSLEGVLSTRFELAKLVGFPTYSALALKDKMAKSPENVFSFLSSLSGMENPRWNLSTEKLYEKSSIGAAHFTIKCSRRIDDDIVLDLLQKSDSLLTGSANNKVYQLPIVALVCNFKPPKVTSPTLLSLPEVETLFHEMGHAIHSMLGKTDYQNISGTRCPIDFVELPSILMESFVSSYKVLNTFARNYESGQKLDKTSLLNYLEMKHKLNPFDMHSQIFMSALDLNFHGDLLNNSEFLSKSNKSLKSGFSIDILKNMHADNVFGCPDNRIFPYVNGTSWHGQFTHLLGYGSCYYSYLFDRVLAGVIYKNLFTPLIESQITNNERSSDVRIANSSSNNFYLGDKFRAAGEAYRSEMLMWGGGRDPWISLAKLFDSQGIVKDCKVPEILSNGDCASMDLVGSWGLPT
ncbi:hypothetical protein BB561_002040 [Smittium simulii]|uniref:mitochondrial intermediate peptidase n=1 Tax=Smittium simulii TaxID=133385 RepID=A0A2T9YRW7_9FUNG|nr:hypothetical protein BB561_002040 [Smittium simulii]